MNSDVRVYRVENKPTQLLTSSDFPQTEPRIEQISLRILVMFMSTSPMCTARFVCLTCVTLKNVDAKKGVISKTQNVLNFCLLSDEQHTVIRKPLEGVGQRYSGYTKRNLKSHVR